MASQHSDSAAGRSADPEDLQRFLVVTLGEHRLAIPVDAVRSTTEEPALTRVPRSPESIRGLTDIRGEITAVVEPRIHFPTERHPPDERQLVIIDRPADRQSAGILVDTVAGVESVPGTDVLDEEDIEAAVLEHPLVLGLVRQEERREFDPRELLGRQDEGADEGEVHPLAHLEERLGARREGDLDLSDIEAEAEDESAGSTVSVDVPDVDVEDLGLEEFDVPEGDPDEEPSADEEPGTAADVMGAGPPSSSGIPGAAPGDGEQDPDPEVTMTPIVDVERLLLASSPRA